MKIDRLMGIVVYLLNHGRTSAQKLAEKFEVSARTIVRDLEALDAAGIPIQSFYGVNGGYQIMDEFVLRKQAVTRNEYDWIVSALKAMGSAYSNKQLEHILEKAKSVNRTGNNFVSLDFGIAAENCGINRLLSLIEDAINHKRIVRFSYTNSHDESKIIQTEPVQLQYKWYNWYLIGYSEKHRDYRMFKLVRISDFEVTDMKCAESHDPANINLKENNSDITHIRICGKSIIKSKCREYLNGEITQEFENGDFEFSFYVPEHEIFWYGALLSFGDKARVIEPAKIKERILQTCREILHVYDE